MRALKATGRSIIGCICLDLSVGPFGGIMPEINLPQMDLVRELRLRQWARQNYVLEDSRKSTWHPIVLDEMQRRDLELVAYFVTESLRAAEANPEPELPVAIEPNQDSLETEVVSHAPDVDVSLGPGARFVPLEPTGDWRFDGGTNEIPKPHYLSSSARAVDLALERNYR